MDRRKFLQLSIPATLIGLAGCSDGDPTPTPGAGDTPTTAATDSPTATATDPPPATDSPTATESPTPTDTQAPTESPTPTDTPTPEPTPTPQPDLTVEVGADGLRFTPKTFTIAAGDTVLWIWRSGGHNVKPDGIPSGSDWSGTPGGRVETFGEGYRYSYTFDTPGQYDYLCVPHQSSGMRGSFTVE